MARPSKKKRKPSQKPVAKANRTRPVRALLRFLMRWAFRAVVLVVAVLVLGLLAYRFINPPTTPYMFSEARRLGGIERTWVSLEDMAPELARSAVAAEDANFCLHWGFDMAAIRAALDSGGNRGASTISQQVVKNTFLWHGRSWTRKALEAMITPAMEAVWPKWRVLEIYLNVAEFDEGVFGVEAAAQHYFGVSAKDLSATQAARLAVVLPNPKGRDAARLGPKLRKRASGIADGAATIRADGRSACFED